MVRPKGEDDDWEVDKETMEKRKEEQEEHRKEAIENPDPEREHQIYREGTVRFRWNYDYIPSQEMLSSGDEERLDERTVFPDYRCECGIGTMSEEEAIEHIENVQ